MHRTIVILAGEVALEATLYANRTAEAVWEALPLAAPANVWGQEIYLTVPVVVPLDDDSREEMAVGELAYWPDGPAVCVFFGSTPASVGREPRAISPVNPFGLIAADPTALEAVKAGDHIWLERKE